MNQFYAASIGLVMVLFLFSRGKRPKNLFKHPFNVSSSPNESPISLVLNKNSLDEETIENIPESNNSFTLPLTKKTQIALKKQLFFLISCGPEERLSAVSIAAAWGNPVVLPILRRGLKDSDSCVVKQSALALEQFRGTTISLLKKSQKKVRPPRNVSLMR